MRFRTDGWHYADLKANGWVFGGDGEKCYETYFSEPAERDKAKAEWDATPQAEPGDVWRIHWYKEGRDGPVAGYAICCPGCKKVHNWTTAGNCGQKIQCSYKDKDGKDVPYTSCVHSGVSSCWDWTGSAESGTLTAHPSLQVTAEDCHWHGWLQNGDLHT